MPSFTAFLFGVTVAIAIGPIALLIVNASASTSLGTGVSSAIGAAVGDFTFALVAFLVGSLVVDVLVAHRYIVSILASLVLVAFGAWLAIHAVRRSPEKDRALPETFLRRSLQTTYVLTMLNPLTIVAFVGLAPLYNGVRSPLLAFWYALCAGVGSLSIQLLLALGGAGVGRVLRRRRNLRLLNFVSGVGIAAFGLAGLAHLFGMP